MLVHTTLIAASLLVPSIGPASEQVASCERGPVTIGSGSPDWRRTSLAAGPVGVARHPLSRMTRTRNGQLISKMPLLVEGYDPVRVVVPRAERRRVFLYYGRFRGRDGRPTTLISAAPGFSAVTFEPCADRPRTVWLGGIRLKGRRAVHLTVLLDGGRRSIRLRLGRPAVIPDTA
jgi:hypothetical protein